MLFSGKLKILKSKLIADNQNDFIHHISSLGKYLKPWKKILILSLLLSCISTVLGMIQPYFAKIIIDRVFIARNTGLLLPVLSLLLFLLILSFLIRIINSYIYTRYSAGILFAMREDLFEHVQKIPLSYFTRQKIGDIYSRIATDMADIQTLVTDIFPSFLFNMLTCVIAAGILIFLNWKMAILSFAFIPFALLIIHRLRPKLLDLGHQVAQTNADISHFLFESLSNTSVIRAFGAEKIERQRLNEKQSHILNFLLKYQILGAVSGSVPTIFIVLNAIIVFGYGGYLVLENALSIGSLVAFSVYQGRVLGPLRGLLEGFLSMQKSKVSLSRVREILDIAQVHAAEDGLIPDEADFRGDIVFKNVCFGYEKESILENISFHIPGGKVTAVIGPSGVGKTTICHLIMRLIDPGSGEITLDGIDLRKINPEWLRKQVAIVSQDIFLFHTSILENIRFSKNSADLDEVKEAAKSACINDFIQSLPEGYNTIIGDRGVRLSGGQKQRISIAMAILLKPKILILDEATAFLDVSTEDRLKDTLRLLMENRTILVVSHRFSAIEHADKMIALEKKGIAYDGTGKGFINGFEHSNN